MEEDDFYEAVSDPDDARGMIWILVHWLLPAKATKADAEALIRKAYDERSTGIEISERGDWLCSGAVSYAKTTS